MRLRLKILLAAMVVLGVAVGWRWSHLPGGQRGTRVRPGAGSNPDAPRPNILLISLDTVRPDHLGCYGYKPGVAGGTSPNLDRFAGTAIRFSQVRAQASWTIPSHMSLFTGRLPSSDGFDGWGRALPLDIPTLAQTLQEAGYHTVGIVNNGGLQSVWGFGRGYDAYNEYQPGTPGGRGNAISARALEFFRTGGAGEGKNLGFGIGDWGFDSGGMGGVGAGGGRVEAGGGSEGSSASSQVPNSKIQISPRPWFLFLHYYDAHDPYTSAQPYYDRFGAVSPEQADKIYHEHFRPDQPFTDPKDLAKLMASYDAGIATLDAEVGKVLAAVPANTLVVVFSDHGEAFKEHGWLWHGSTLYEEEVRTVLMVRPPQGNSGGGGGGRVINDPVMLMDVAPTILATCGIQAPDTYEGSDLTPLIEGGKLDDRLISMETKSYRAGRVCKAVMLGSWKLIHHVVTGAEELYHLPDEQTNLIRREPKMAQTLQEPMRRWVNQESFWVVWIDPGGKNLGFGIWDLGFDGAVRGSASAPSSAPGTAPAPAPAPAPGSVPGSESPSAKLPVPPEFESMFEAENGHIATLIPINLTIPELDTCTTLENGKFMKWTGHPGRRLQAVYIETLPTDAPLIARLEIDHKSDVDRVFVGPAGVHPAVLPSGFWIGPAGVVPRAVGPRLSLGPEALDSPVVEKFFTPTQVGYSIRRFQTPGKARTAAPSAPMIDQRSRDQMKKLGYLE